MFDCRGNAEVANGHRSTHVTTEQNKETIRRYWAAVNMGDAKAAASFWAAESVNHGREREHEEVEKLHESLVQVYEHITVHEVVAEGDWVACRITAQGRHKTKPTIPFDSGIYQIAKPEGSLFTFQHIHLFRLADGKIREHWANRDDLGAAKQLGLELVPARNPGRGSDVMKKHLDGRIRPTAVLWDMRKSVSKILGRRLVKRTDHQALKADQRTLAIWAADCAEHVLPYFEEKYPNDDRPRKAIEVARAWVDTGVFKMAVIRRASLDAHAAARQPRADGEDAACFAAHAAGQAVGTAHVVTHSLGSSLYAIRAAAAYSGNVDDGLVKERDWQLRHLTALRHL